MRGVVWFEPVAVGSPMPDNGEGHVWVQADALIAFCNDSTLELVSVPAFTAPKGVLRTAPRELELELELGK